VGRALAAGSALVPGMLGLTGNLAQEAGITCGEVDSSVMNQGSNNRRCLTAEHGAVMASIAAAQELRGRGGLCRHAAKEERRSGAGSC
jgi:hypothetical protein